jgi:SAM-dependent methyltransferase
LSAGRCAVCDAELDPRPLINGADLLHNTKGTFTVHVCPDCGAGNTRPLADEAALASYYTAGYGPHGETSGSLANRLRGLVTRREMRVGAPRALPKRPGRLLDVGCGTGALGAVMIARGWEVDGIDPSESACEQARLVGIEARAGTLETVTVHSERYDAVVFNQSLEHIGAPRSALRRVHRALAPGGVMAISVPNFDCRARRRFGRDWFHLDLPRHRVHFGERSLRILLERAGFDAVELWTSTSSTGLIGSIQYRVLGGLAAGEGGVREMLGWLAALLLVPAARIEQALGGGRDFLHAVGRRR